MTDLYHNIYRGEIFEKSRCIWHENALMDFFRSNLIALGYQSVNDSNKVWRRNGKTVVVCLVDDFSTCTNDYSTALPYWFDSETVVITDNQINAPTQYKLCPLPSSFFGIYWHEPQQIQWCPERRFNFSINRIDVKRMFLFLELWHRCRRMPEASALDYVNFNCWAWDGDNQTPQGLVDNFKRQWELLDSNYHNVYNDTYQDLLKQLPFRNHTLDHETSHVSAWMNVVAETYSSDTTVALSEKIFRTLCLPVPWIVYSGKHTVAYLHSLGFDTLQDLVPHRYDNMIENRTAAYGDKTVDFIFEGVETVSSMKLKNFEELQQRCQRAAVHNQQLLKNMQQQWPQDFAAWWPTVVQSIS
jgi:hypothetical protein